VTLTGVCGSWETATRPSGNPFFFGHQFTWTHEVVLPSHISLK
jgi:hypothetical protein